MWIDHDEQCGLNSYCKALARALARAWALLDCGRLDLCVPACVPLTSCSLLSPRHPTVDVRVLRSGLVGLCIEASIVSAGHLCGGAIPVSTGHMG